MESSAFSEQIHRSESDKKDRANPALDHAWNWFKYHAEQRMVMIRLYLIIAGALGAGYITLSNNGSYSLSLLLAMFAGSISFLFWRLDRRVSFLVKQGEAAMAKIEQEFAIQTGYAEFNIVQRAESDPSKWLGSYSRAFRAMFISALGVTFVAALFAAHKIFDFSKIVKLFSDI